MFLYHKHYSKLKTCQLGKDIMSQFLHLMQEDVDQHQYHLMLIKLASLSNKETFRLFGWMILWLRQYGDLLHFIETVRLLHSLRVEWGMDQHMEQKSIENTVTRPLHCINLPLDSRHTSRTIFGRVFAYVYEWSQPALSFPLSALPRKQNPVKF
jgi:hypothetical protein